MFPNKINLEKPLIPNVKYSHIVFNNGTYINSSSLDLYKESMEKNLSLKNKEIRILFHLYDKDNKILYETFGPNFRISCGVSDIVETNRRQQEFTLNNFLKYCKEKLLEEYKEAKENVCYYEQLCLTTPIMNKKLA